MVLIYTNSTTNNKNRNIFIIHKAANENICFELFKNMSKLVKELEQEHKEITDLLHKIQKIGIISNEGMQLLIKSKTLFSDHLTKEDEQLYPPLIEKAKTDLIFKRTLDTFGAEMDKITKSVSDFYKKHTDTNNINKTEFIKDVSAFIATLKTRMMKEEVAIYKYFEKLKLD